ncbi:MAG: T9SS type A sorting domain-containing protein, partial [Fibrobacter sp.]|nr:T9SS type A sorting domain-containing protein [Fibrobacter sp.]
NVILSSSSEGSSNSSSSKVVEPTSSSGKEQGLAAFAKTMRDIYYDSPSSNLIFSAERVTKLKIFGINGRQIEMPVLKKMGDVHMLNLSALRAGIYIVRFTTGLGPSTVKIVKN